MRSNAAVTPSDAAFATTAMQQLPVGWRPNLGQVADANGHPLSDVFYSAEVPGARRRDSGGPLPRLPRPARSRTGGRAARPAPDRRT
jgi:hypothetical protein